MKNSASQGTSGLSLKKATWLSAFTMACTFWALSFSLAYAYPEFRSDAHRGWYKQYGWVYLAQLNNPGLRLASQCWQESRFNPNAYNQTSGAAGECQFMPPAWGECIKSAGQRNVSRFNSRWSVRCAGWYDRRLGGIWTSKRTELQRWELVTASFNAGAGNVLKAQRACGMKSTWRDIAPCMVRVTGRHAQETLDYVRKIAMWYRQMICHELKAY